MTLNVYLNRLRFVKGSNRAMLWINGVVPSLMCTCILMKQHGVRSGKYLLKPLEMPFLRLQNFHMSLDATALKNLCLWCEFQNCLLFIISLLIKNFLTALNS